jgi:hypothetical protein
VSTARAALVRRAGTRVRQATLGGRLAWLRRRNERSRESLLGDAPVAVSLTTHGGRIDNVFYAIEAIGAGTARPGRIVLWLDDEAAAAAPPPALERLRTRGLEIRLTRNFGPHTKYYPYVVEKGEHRIPLVTADDDVLYARDWLTALLAGAGGDGAREVVCHRARRIRVDGDRIAPYDTWPFATDTRATVRTFATGVGGVLYPPELLEALHDAGEAFRDCCPKADDVWLHAVTLRSGYRARQLADVAREGPYVPYGKDQSLWRTNVVQGGNDDAIAATYTAADVRALVAGE